MKSRGAVVPTTLGPVFRRLRAVLHEQQGGCRVNRDTATCFGLEAPVGPATIKVWGGRERATSMPVAWVEVRKNYVSYHLMGIYMNPSLVAKLSDSLRAHMQGKSCFNFREVDEPLFRELGKVTSKSLSMLKKGGFVAIT